MVNSTPPRDDARADADATRFASRRPSVAARSNRRIASLNNGANAPPNSRPKRPGAGALYYVDLGQGRARMGGSAIAQVYGQPVTKDGWHPEIPHFTVRPRFLYRSLEIGIRASCETL